MKILRSKNAVDKVISMTIEEIQAIEQTSTLNTIHKQVKELLSLGWVAEGFKCGRAKTYHVTEKGLEQIPIKNNNKVEVVNSNE
jgi:chromosome segregation and condensation protein ScpB